MINIVNDVATLSTIPEKTLIKLLSKVMYCICQGIQEDLMEEKSLSEFDLGIGILYIKYQDSNNIKYKFVPSEELQKNISKTVDNKLNLLEDVLNTSLAQKFANIYKDLC